MEKYGAYRENTKEVLVNDLTTEQEQIQAQKFIVYYTDENIFFINAYLIRRFGIEPKGPSITVDDTPYIQVYRDDIDYIVSESKGTLIPEYKHYETKKDKKPVDYDYANDGITKNNYYTYYEDIENNKLYVTEDIKETLKELNINLDESSKEIEGKPCYPINKDLLDALKQKGYIGQKQSLLKKHEEKEIGVCELNGDIFIPESILAKYSERNKDDALKSKKIKVDNELFIKISKEALDKLIKFYYEDDINLKFKELKIKPKNDMTDSLKEELERAKANSELEQMLDIIPTTPPTEPTNEK